MPSTNIGRVQPIFKGTWSSSSAYEKLDNVLYNGNTYIALKEVPVGATGITPGGSSEYWQLIASKGDTGGIGSVSAIASASESAWASAYVSGDDPTAMNFTFQFGLPKGDEGDPAAIASATASITTLGATDNPTVNVTLTGPSTNATLDFNFGMPAVAGGVATVNEQSPVSGNVTLTATNVGAVPAPSSGSISTSQYLYYNNEGTWVGRSINEVPTANPSNDLNKYLRYTNNGMIWANIQSLPSGGTTGAPLVKTSNNDYAVQWGSVISSADIDNIINAE